MNLFRRKKRSSNRAPSPFSFLFEDGLGLYQSWYFELRLREEIDRSSRYGLSFALILIALPASAGQSQQSRAASLTLQSIRSVDLAGFLEPGLFALCLVHCDEDGAEAAEGRLAEALKQFKPALGMVVFPLEATNQADVLIATARERLLAGRAA